MWLISSTLLRCKLVKRVVFYSCVAYQFAFAYDQKFFILCCRPSNLKHVVFTTVLQLGFISRIDSHLVLPIVITHLTKSFVLLRHPLHWKLDDGVSRDWWHTAHATPSLTNRPELSSLTKSSGFVDSSLTTGLWLSGPHLSVMWIRAWPGNTLVWWSG